MEGIMFKLKKRLLALEDKMKRIPDLKDEGDWSPNKPSKEMDEIDFDMKKLSDATKYIENQLIQLRRETTRILSNAMLSNYMLEEATTNSKKDFDELTSEIQSKIQS